MLNLKQLKDKGYCISKANALHELETIIYKLEDTYKIKLERDVVVSSYATGDQLKSELGDFWYHSDGAFLPVPPSFILIQVLECSSGGEISLLDTISLNPIVPNTSFFFGKNEKGIVSKIVSYDEKNKKRIFKYRKDYMSSSENTEALEKFNQALASFSKNNEINIGELLQGELIIVDNWRMLHRRKEFYGERVIKRLWFFDRTTT